MVGSGLWENVLSPAFHFVMRWMLDLTSPGFASYKNSVYQQIAADNPSDVSVSALGLVTGIFILAVSWHMRYGFVKNNSERSRIQRTLSSLSASDVGSPISQESAAELRGRLERQLIALRNIRRTDLVFSGMVTVCLVVELIAWNGFSYINSADAHYHQVLRIAAPYLAAGEQAQTDSERGRTTSTCYPNWKANAKRMDEPLQNLTLVVCSSRLMNASIGTRTQK